MFVWRIWKKILVHKLCTYIHSTLKGLFFACTNVLKQNSRLTHSSFFVVSKYSNWSRQMLLDSNKSDGSWNCGWRWRGALSITLTSSFTTNSCLWESFKNTTSMVYAKHNLFWLNKGIVCYQKHNKNNSLYALVGETCSELHHTISLQFTLWRHYYKPFSVLAFQYILNCRGATVWFWVI